MNDREVQESINYAKAWERSHFIPSKEMLHYYTNMPDYYDSELDLRLQDQGFFFYHKKVINGVEVVCALRKLAFTFGLCCDVDPDERVSCGYSYRYCYPHLADAYKDLREWSGAANPDGPWAVRKGVGGDIRNPKIKKVE